MNTMPLEADTRILINNNLKNLGWNFTGKSKNVFSEQPKTENERKKLCGKRPDYVLYSKDGEPLIVIEAKKRGERIDNALEQGIFYAKTLEAPLVFATDGVFCKSYHTKANRSPILNGEEVDEFIREALALRYLNTWEVNTISPKVQYDRKELIKIFDEANNMLRGDGLRAGIERFGEFANILFLKLISESEQIKRESGMKTAFDTACSWDSIKNIPISTRIEYINKTVYEKLNKLYNTEIFTPLTIRDVSILKEIMDKLDPLTLTDVDSDVKGDAFEYFLKESTSTKNDLGEYFTPRHIVKTMVRLVNPQIGEKVYDPFCGTGGFLIETFRHIERNMVGGNQKLQKILKEETIYGNEITNTARITKMNMILVGDGHSNIHMRDSLANPVYFDEIVKDDDGEICRDTNKKIELTDDNYNSYDVVITNMPYSQKTKYGNLYDIPSTNGDSICVQHCITAINKLSENGRIALVVPEGFLFRKDLAKAREYMLEHCELKSIISLPQGVFLPYTGVKTNIIYATKVNKKTKKLKKGNGFWYFDVKSDGYSLDNHRRKLHKPSDLSKFEEYRKLDSEQATDMMQVGFELIPLEKVRNNSYVLVGSRYRERVLTNTEHTYRPLKEICDIIAGQSPESENYNTSNKGLPFYQGNANFGDVYIKSPKMWTTQVTKEAVKGDLLLSVRAPVGAVNICLENICIGRGLMALRCKNDVNYQYLLYILKSCGDKFKQLSMGSTFEAVTKKDVEEFLVPVPSLDNQQKIVDEVERFQHIIDGAKSVTENYRPSFQINPEWETKELSEVCSFEYGYTDTASNDGDTRFIRITDINIDGTLSNSDIKYVNLNDNNKKYLLKNNDLLVARIGATFGKTLLFQSADNAIFASYLIRLKLKDNILPKYYFYFSQHDYYWQQANDLVTGGGQPQFNANTIRLIKIPIPSLEEQEQIVSQIEREQTLVEPSKHLIELFDKKIHKRIADVWGDK